MSTNKNWMVLVLKEGITELRGIYPTKRAAEFIAAKLKEQEKLSKDPKVTPTSADVFPQGNRVEEFLESRNTVRSGRKKVIQYLPKKG